MGAALWQESMGPTVPEEDGAGQPLNVDFDSEAGAFRPEIVANGEPAPKKCPTSSKARVARDGKEVSILTN